jgi:hypothetical protein
LRLTFGPSTTFCSCHGGSALKIHGTVSAGRLKKNAAMIDEAECAPAANWRSRSLAVVSPCG